MPRITIEAGDTIECLASCGSAVEGETYSVFAYEDGQLFICQDDDEENEHCTCDHNWKLLHKGKVDANNLLIVDYAK